MTISFHPAKFDASANRFEMVGGEEDEVSLAGENGKEVGRLLGLRIIDNEMEPMAIGEFINRCTNFLRASLGRPSAAREATVEAAPGRATVHHGGDEQGAVQRRVERILESVRRGRAEGATHVFAA